MKREFRRDVKEISLRGRTVHKAKTADARTASSDELIATRERVRARKFRELFSRTEKQIESITRLPPAATDKESAHAKEAGFEILRRFVIDAEKILHTMVEKSPMIPDMRSRYVVEHITPFLEREATRHPYNTGVYRLIDKDIRKALDISNPYRADTEKGVRDTGRLLIGMTSILNPLFEGDDIRCIQFLVAERIKQTFNSSLRKLGISTKMELTNDLITARSYALSLSAENPAYDDLVKKYYQPREYKINSLQDIAGKSGVLRDLWEVIRTTPLIRAYVGDIIDKTDEEVYQTASTMSLSPSRDASDSIALLRYFPTPDAIRNLVLLESGRDESWGAGAQITLNSLAQRKDWGEKLSNAIKQYPSLASVRDLIASERLQDPPGVRSKLLREKSQELALTFLESKDSDLVEVCYDALSNENLLRVMEHQGLLSSTLAVSLRAGEEFLKTESNKAEQRTREAANEGSAPLSDKYTVHFAKALRSALAALRDKGKSDFEKEAAIKTLKGLGTYSRVIAAPDFDVSNLPYAASKNVIDKTLELYRHYTDTKSIEEFVNAAAICPELNKSEALRKAFCKVGIPTEQESEFFRDMTLAYGKIQNGNPIPYITAVQNGHLTRKRALELPAKADDILAKDHESYGTSYPAIFLQTDAGIDLLRIMVAGKGDMRKKPDSDRALGAHLEDLVQSGMYDHQYMAAFARLYGRQRIRMLDNQWSASNRPSLAIDDDNWIDILIAYSATNEDDLYQDRPKEFLNQVEGLFNDKNIKDFILAKLKQEMGMYVSQTEQQALPFSLRMLVVCASQIGNLGPLTHAEAITDFLRQLQNVRDKRPNLPRTQEAAFAGIRRMEQRMQKERWSNDDQTEFYNLSSTILKASPRLFLNCLNLMEVMDRKDLEEFSRILYPLYHACVVFAEHPALDGEIDGENREYDPRKIATLRNDIRVFAEKIKIGSGSLAEERMRTFTRLKEEFQTRFGITAIPENFTQEHSRSLLNSILYGAHLASRTPQRESILAYYLALMLNGTWDAFREGQAADPADLLTPEKAALIAPLLEEWKKSALPAAEIVGIEQGKIVAFTKAMQTETRNLVAGNVQTVDTRLGDFTANLRELSDPDLYQNAFDRQRMQLLLAHSPQMTAKVIAEMHQAHARGETRKPLSEQERKIKTAIEAIAGERGIVLSQETIKKHFQDELRPFAVIAQLLRTIEEQDVDKRIDTLRSSLQPPEQIIALFQRLGEEFTQTSGAYALSHDLDYLESLIVKKEQELSNDEKRMLSEYIEHIRKQLIELEQIYDRIKDQFRALEKIKDSLSPFLREKTAELEKIITSGTESITIASAAVHDLNAIIENIRECLSCRSGKGSNNDTNLTFGEPTKFFVYSTAEGMQKGSIADQIVYFFPIQRVDGQKEYAFTLDRIYGMKSATVLSNHIRVILKKMEILRSQFPEARISLFIPQAATSSAATSFEHLSRILREQIGEHITFSDPEEATLTVTRSAFGDHYLEVGGDARNTGKRKVTGIFITQNA